MEVAAGGPGDRPVTTRPPPRCARPSSRASAGCPAATRSSTSLALLLACGCVFGGVLVVQAHRDRDRDAAEQERYGDVLAAADAEVTRCVNIDYRNAQDSFDAVAAGATGEFADQYKSGTDVARRPADRRTSR